ncbi:6,7-dimethyl-8-ribityllumazine synthase [Kordia sp. YSTF-M3]|uniref:6,7-dimethyl-8-ribityllumazine synthase n=1 Tax=Kordia aestuariivivens TaxID=2759037 RepID=A0ABR7Q5C4_9FLAO|nr:6,7-dimethyl-8-ribityllumazine synthase [Kordia aestuariivivens]MBC8753761.1 6,7-dimethyl-8-ribityllumazine synthase [Kordia aestuariivivens]
MATVNKNLSIYDKATIPNAKDFRFGIVVSEWNENITEGLCKGAIAALTENGVTEANIIRWDVPGSYELVYGAKRMLQTQNVDAIIAIGSVIQGETKHFDFVCSATAHGIKDLNVNHNTPVIFCVLTDNTLQQAIDRSGGIHGNKGVEAAVAAIKMAALRKL